MIDLHAHTTYSDGTFTPEELLQHAVGSGLSGLAITDHDTFAGYDHAATLERPKDFDLVCGIELTTRRGRSSVHVLGYFPVRPPSARFREQLHELYSQRNERNLRLTARLQSLGIDIEYAEVQAIGRFLTARPHFAQVLVAKGYASSYDDAFNRYLGEDGSAYVVREAPSVPEGIRWIREAGGIASLAHPVRLKMNAEEEAAFIAGLVDNGLQAIEVYHSDHSATDSVRYLKLVQRHNLLITGGSDFHGDIKPNISLGSQDLDIAYLNQLRLSQP